jgi:hypothetical protein
VSAALYNSESQTLEAFPRKQLTYITLVFVQLGGVIANNIYRDHDKPLYRRGNRILVGINVLSIFLFIFAKVYYVTKNKIRDRKWNTMTPEVSW